MHSSVFFIKYINTVSTGVQIMELLLMKWKKKPTQEIYDKSDTNTEIWYEI